MDAEISRLRLTSRGSDVLERVTPGFLVDSSIDVKDAKGLNKPSPAPLFFTIRGFDCDWHVPVRDFRWRLSRRFESLAFMSTVMVKTEVVKVH